MMHAIKFDSRLLFYFYTTQRNAKKEEDRRRGWLTASSTVLDGTWRQQRLTQGGRQRKELVAGRNGIERGRERETSLSPRRHKLLYTNTPTSFLDVVWYLRVWYDRQLRVYVYVLAGATVPRVRQVINEN